MQRKRRMRAFWMVLIGSLVAAAIAVPLWVTASSGEVRFTATLYSDVVRFEADGVDSLRVTIYDLSENELWSSGQVMGDFVDWDRTNERGERLANGYYLYLAQGWDASDRLVLNKAGKVVLLPGDQVELQYAPRPSGPIISGDPLPGEESGPIYGPLGLYDTGIFYRVGIGTDPPAYQLHISASWPTVKLEATGTNSAQMTFSSGGGMGFFAYTGSTNLFRFGNYTAGGDVRILAGGNNERMSITAAGNVGIGTTSPNARLTVQATTGDLIAAYNSGDRVFVVESDGTVRADGTVYADAFVPASGADVAERINVSEWVEAGDVVEIDPEHVGFFQKASEAYSRRVAGIISTSPGVILGNDVDPTSDEWNDNRPVLAIAGRVPVKASAENGPIAVGDLLVSSSVPGVAMKGDPAISIGAVVGKAMEPFEEGEGTIMCQVTLR